MEMKPSVASPLKGDTLTTAPEVPCSAVHDLNPVARRKIVTAKAAAPVARPQSGRKTEDNTHYATTQLATYTRIILTLVQVLLTLAMSGYRITP